MELNLSLYLSYIFAMGFCWVSQLSLHILPFPAPSVHSLFFNSFQDNIADTVIKSIQPYIDSDEFQPAAIAKVSKACTSICQWVRAMHKYHFVAKAVEPKRVSTSEMLLQSSLTYTLKRAHLYRGFLTRA